MDAGLDAGAIAALVYGVLTFVGGIIGYVQAKSTPSLISGVISGILLIAGGILSLNGVVWAETAALVITVLLVIVFAWRLVKTKRFFPAGLMTAAGIAAIIVMLAG